MAKSISRLCWLKNLALTDCANSPALDMSAARKLVAGLARPLAQRAAPRAPAAARSMSGLGEQLGKVRDVPLKDAPGFIASQRNDPKTQAAAKVRFECRPCPLVFSNDELWTRALALPPPRRPRAFLYVEAVHILPRLESIVRDRGPYRARSDIARDTGLADSFREVSRAMYQGDCPGWWFPARWNSVDQRCMH